MISELALERLIHCNYSSREGMTVKKITIHHAAGNVSIDGFYSIFNNKDRKASANYCIDSEGTIVCLVDEDYRAWTSGSKWNDCQAITIEVANSTLQPFWEISEQAYDSLVSLCADICKRYHINPRYDGTIYQSFTFHEMFQATNCPGYYIKKNIYKIIDDIKIKMAMNICDNLNNSTDYKQLFDYAVKIDTDMWLRNVNVNGDDYAGIHNVFIKGLVIYDNGQGHFKYRVHTKKSGWLPYVYSYNSNINDDINGYAGDDSFIDMVEIYYYTNENYIKENGYLYAKYRVSERGEEYYPYQIDTETTQGQDGFAGLEEHYIDRIELQLTNNNTI